MTYLGETELTSLVGTPFEHYTKADWVLYYVSGAGQCDGGHHKQWVLDQISRIINGTKIIVKVAKWDNHADEYRVSTGEPSRKYLKWVEMMRGEKDHNGDYEYDYDEGICP